MNIYIPLSWTILLLVLLLMPGSSIPTTNVYAIPNIDKVAHFILFGGLIFWWGVYFRSRIENGRWSVRVWTLIFYAIMLGAVIECVQLAFIPNRDFDLVDIAANSLGALISGLGLIFFYHKSY